MITLSASIPAARLKVLYASSNWSKLNRSGMRPDRPGERVRAPDRPSMPGVKLATRMRLTS